MSGKECKASSGCKKLVLGMYGWYEEKPPIIWLPNFELAATNSIEESIEEKFMTIQNVSSISLIFAS